MEEPPSSPIRRIKRFSTVLDSPARNTRSQRHKIEFEFDSDFAQPEIIIKERGTFR
jgi:hypothetical protein